MKEYPKVGDRVWWVDDYGKMCSGVILGYTGEDAHIKQDVITYETKDSIVKEPEDETAK